VCLNNEWPESGFEAHFQYLEIILDNDLGSQKQRLCADFRNNSSKCQQYQDRHQVFWLQQSISGS